jgi:hypothetical protein
MSIVITEKLAEEIKVGDLIRDTRMISFQKVNRINRVGGRVDLWLDKNIINGRKQGVSQSTLWSVVPVEVKEIK